MNDKKVAVVGAGLIGSGWAARFILNGYDVQLYDAYQSHFSYTERIILNATKAYEAIFENFDLKKGKLIRCHTLADCLHGVDYVQEAIPERYGIKIAAYQEFEKKLSSYAVIASSTSGLLPSKLQKLLKNPERLIVAHPFNPVYLLPVVELVPGVKTSQHTLETSQRILRDVGMHPIVIKKEIAAFVADRLLEALWRESLWLVKDDIATTKEIDDIIRYGFGLRYAQMGIFETYKIAGADQGMSHFLKQFGPALKWNWSKLMDVPELDEELINKIVSQVDEQSEGLSIDQLEKNRDQNLIEIIKSLKKTSSAVGVIFNQHEKRLSKQKNKASITSSKFLRSYKTSVKAEWVDYNNHLSESYYAQIFSFATDEVLFYLGLDDEYMNQNASIFTAETHVRFLQQCHHNDEIIIDTQLISYDSKRMHLIHFMKNTDKTILATSELMLLSVQLKPSQVIPFLSPIKERLFELTRAQKKLKKPDFVSKSIQEIGFDII